MNRPKTPDTGHELTEEFVLAQGYQHARQLPDGRWLAVLQMIFNGRLYFDLDRIGFESCYCYKTLAEAYAAMMAFDPDVDDEPQGWFKDPGTNRCRPNGDKSKESIGWPKDD